MTYRPEPFIEGFMEDRMDAIAVEAYSKLHPQVQGAVRRDVRTIYRAAEPFILEDHIAKLESLLLDPADSTTPHCVEEYNAGLRNAIAVLRGEVD